MQIVDRQIAQRDRQIDGWIGRYIDGFIDMDRQIDKLIDRFNIYSSIRKQIK